MVTEYKLFIKLLQNRQSIDDGHTNLIKTIIDTFPYFQPAHILHTFYLKKHHLYYQNALQQTAARTTDRRRLFEIIQIETEIDKKNTDNENQNIHPKQFIQQPESNDAIEVFIPVETTHKPQSVEKQEKTEKNIPEPDKNENQKPEKLSYLEWLKQLKQVQNEKKEDIFDAIDKFLKEKPKIIPKKDITVKPPDIIEKSVTEKQMLMTETLANLYVKQKKYDKAIQAFRILSLKYPKKSSYFANRIKEVKNLK
jgi:hypothetical protein